MILQIVASKHFFFPIEYLLIYLMVTLVVMLLFSGILVSRLTIDMKMDQQQTAIII